MDSKPYKAKKFTFRKIVDIIIRIKGGIDMTDRTLINQCIYNQLDAGEACTVLRIDLEKLDSACMLYFGKNYTDAALSYMTMVTAELKNNVIESALSGNTRDIRYVLRNLGERPWVAANAPLPIKEEPEEGRLTPDELAMLEAYRKLREGAL